VLAAWSDQQHQDAADGNPKQGVEKADKDNGIREVEWRRFLSREPQKQRRGGQTGGQYRKCRVPRLR